MSAPVIQLSAHRPWGPGVVAFIGRVRDLIERGHLDIAQLRLADVMGWLLARCREQATDQLARTPLPSGGMSGGEPHHLAELCGALQAAARLALLKARRLNGWWHVDDADPDPPWAGPPPELPLRRSWLGSRLAQGPLSFVASVRAFEDFTPPLAPVAPARLRAAMLAVLQRQRAREQPVAGGGSETRAPRLSTEVCAALVLERVRQHGEVRLHGVAGDSRDAHVAAFLACLILARQGQVTLVQDELFGEILVRPGTEALGATA